MEICKHTQKSRKLSNSLALSTSCYSCFTYSFFKNCILLKENILPINISVKYLTDEDFSKITMEIFLKPQCYYNIKLTYKIISQNHLKPSLCLVFRYCFQFFFFLLQVTVICEFLFPLPELLFRSSWLLANTSTLTFYLLFMSAPHLLLSKPFPPLSNQFS